MKRKTAKFRVNGESYKLDVASNITLSELLPDRLGLTGTKYGCGQGQCKTCTVLVDSKPALSCITLALTVRDKEILTIEGVAKGGDLHPIQNAFINSGAIQCGFCTPGMILATKSLLEENPDPSLEEIKESLAGHLCRCTGYTKILDAVISAAAAIRRGDG